MTIWILMALLAFPSGPNGPSARRRDRLHVIALAYASELDRAVMTGAFPGHERRLWLAAAIATGYRESGFAESVHAGRRLGDEGRSICLHQINRGNPGAFVKRFPKSSSGSPNRQAVLTLSWRALAGTSLSATRRCIRAGLRSLANMRRHCARRAHPRDLLAATLSAYLSGSSCRVSPEGRRRVELTLSLFRRLGPMPSERGTLAGETSPIASRETL